MGIFNRLAGLFTKEEKAEEETEEKLLLAALVDLKKALESSEKTLEEIRKIEKKLHSRIQLFSMEDLWMYHLKIIKEGVRKTTISLNFTDNYLKTIKKKVEARAASSGNYRRAAFSKKDRLLLNVVEIVPERNSKVIADLIACEEEAKRDQTPFAMSIAGQYGVAIPYRNSDILFSRSKTLIEKSIKDIENYFASQA